MAPDSARSTPCSRRAAEGQRHRRRAPAVVRWPDEDGPERPTHAPPRRSERSSTPCCPSDRVVARAAPPRRALLRALACGRSHVLRPVAAHLRVGRTGAARAQRRARASATRLRPPPPRGDLPRGGRSGGPLLARPGAFVVDGSAPVIAQVQGADVVYDPAILAGLPADFLDGAGTMNPSIVVDLAGRWPEPAWMVSHPFPEPRASGWRIHRRRRNRWEPVPDRIALQSFGWILPFGGIAPSSPTARPATPTCRCGYDSSAESGPPSCRACPASRRRLRPRHRLRARSSSRSRRRCAAGARRMGPP